MYILYKSRQDPYITDWISHQNYTENKSKEIDGMNINIHTQHGKRCAIKQIIRDGIRNAMFMNAELHMLQTYIVGGWPQKKR